MALAVTSIIGTIILQGGSQADYLRNYGPTWTNIIKVLNIDNMYQAPWYLALIGLLCINIVVCSIERLSITWHTIFPKKLSFNPGRFSGRKGGQVVELEKKTGQLQQEVKAVLEKQFSSVLTAEHNDNPCFYTEKGRWTRIGVYIVHTSILLLLVGAIIGAKFGFKAYMNLNEGETSGIARHAKTGAPITIGFQVRCDKFDVQFYDTGSPKEFRSSLTVVEDGKDSFQKDILVNHPLHHKGINIFQSNYGTAHPDGLEMNIIERQTQSITTVSIKNGQTVQLPNDGGTVRLEGFLPHFDFKGHHLGEAFILTVAPSEGEVFQLGMPLKHPTFDKMRQGRYAFTIKDFDQKYYTGLQVTRDPGVPYVYTGFVLMIIGCWVTFFMSHHSFYVEISPTTEGHSRIFVTGSANRNKQGLKLKVYKLAERLKEI